MTCERCNLHKEVQSPFIQSEGADNLDVLIIGMCPSGDEDMLNRPFVGRAGSLLRSSLTTMKSKWRLTYLVKCRPTGSDELGRVTNTEPTKKQIESCIPNLIEEIEKYKPKVLLLMGGSVAKWIINGGTGRNPSVEGMRGVPVKIGGVWVVVTYHPAFALHGTVDLAPLYHEDFRLIDNLVLGNYKPTKVNYKIVDDKRGIHTFVDELTKSNPKVLSIDFETDQNSNDPLRCSLWKTAVRPLCCAVHWVENNEPVNYVLTMEHGESKLKGLDRSVWSEVFRKITQFPLVAHNIQYELGCMKKFFGISPNLVNIIGDTMLFGFILDENRAGGQSLENMSRVYLPELGDYKRETVSAVNSLLKIDRNFNNLPLDMVVRRCAYDVHATLQLFNIFYAKVNSNAGLTYLWEKVIKRAIPLLSGIESRGLPVNCKYIEKLEEKINWRISILNDAIQEHEDVATAKTIIADGTFNVKSNKHLKILLYDVMNLPVTKTSSVTGEPSTDKDVRAAVMERLPLVKAIDVVIKERYKKSAFIDKAEFYVCEDSHVHSSFKLHGAKTGRLASSQPINLQNITHDVDIRRMFQAPYGYKLMEVDGSQMELRVAACLSKDPSC